MRPMEKIHIVFRDNMNFIIRDLADRAGLAGVIPHHHSLPASELYV